MTHISILGLIAALLTTGAYIPQAYKTIKTKSTSDLSTSTFSMLFIGTICWFFYGIFIKDTPIMLANGITGYSDLYYTTIPRQSTPPVPRHTTPLIWV